MSMKSFKVANVVIGLFVLGAFVLAEKTESRAESPPATGTGTSANRSTVEQPSVGRIVLTITEEYGVQGEPKHRVAVFEVLRKMLDEVSIEVTKDTAAKHDAVLRITVNGKALGARYTNIAPSFQYTAARIWGEAVLESGDISSSARFAGNKDPVGNFVFGRIEPRNTTKQAPFDGAFYHSNFARSLARLLSAQLRVDRARLLVGALRANVKAGIPDLEPHQAGWSEHVQAELANVLLEKREGAVDFMVPLLDDKDWRVRRAAVHVLGELTDIRAIQPLIDLMGRAIKARQTKRRDEAEMALRKITGESLGSDPAKWQQWWDDRKTMLLEP